MSTVDAPLLTPQLLAQLERLELVSRKIFRGRMKGERRSKRKGQSVEFADFRSYVAGDDLRFIDWNSFARLDRLFLKLFLEEEDLRFYVLLDTSGSMDFGEPTKARYARQLAAALGFIGLVRGDQVRIETLSQSVRQRGPVWRGRHNVWRMVEQLDRIESGDTTPLAAGTKNFCLRNPGKGVVVLVSDLMDKAGYEDALRWLVAQQMDAYVIHLLSQEELTPDVTGDLRLVDCEDHDVAEVSVSAALFKRYQTNLASFLDGARNFCTRRGMTYLMTTTQLPVETLVSNYLRKGGLVALMGLEWSNNLSLAQWAALAAIPAAIIALYFLKLRRQPLLVPSTYLWAKAIEDLHVNSLWQRLRHSLLLLLQLLLVGLLIAALVNPSWHVTRRTADRNILLIDHSASMGAVDVEPNRLQEAKRRALELVDALRSDDTAMVISFAESAQVVQSFTNNRYQLRRAIDSIGLSDAGTNLEEALRMAGGWSTIGDGASQSASSEVPPARLFIISDGEMPDVQDMELGNLEAEFVPIGTTDAANVAIVALGLDEANSQRATRQVFARLENFGSRATQATVSLELDGQLIDAATVDLPANEATGIAFELGGNIESGVLELRVEAPAEFDQLAIDNRAWAPMNPPRRARVLLVTAGDEPLRAALGTARAMEIASVEVLHPAELGEESYKTKVAAQAFDLIVFDHCQPSEMPQANTLFLGVIPHVGWHADAEVSAPQIIDVDVAHPLMHLVELSDVLVATARPLKTPRGARVLVDSNLGSLLAIAPRDQFEDAVLAFAIAGTDRPETNWPLRLSFPVFVLNTLEYFGPRAGAPTSGIVSPGRTVTLPIESTGKAMRIRDPDGTMRAAPRDRRNTLTFVAAKAGVYDIVEAGQVVSRVAADVLNPRESNIARSADDSIRIGHANIKGETTWESVRNESWKALVIAALAILLVEWYIFNRRVFI